MTAALIVVGGGPAGHAAALAYREADGRGPVLLLAGERRAPYQRPPLSKELLRGETEADALDLADAPDTYNQLDVTVRHATATALTPAARVVTVDGERLAYRHCVLALGALPVRPPLPGAHLPGVHLLRTVADALALRHAAGRVGSGRQIVVLGSGFIGCEAAASLRARGCAVTLVSQEPAPQHERLGPEVARRLARWLADAGVDARYERSIARVERDAAGRIVAHLDDGDTLAADAVLLAGGVRPATDLALAAGVATDDRGAIVADAHQRTSAPGVLACGDCAVTHHALAGRPLHVEHWGDALAQGEIAGRTAAGHEATWDTVPGFWSTIGGRTLKQAAWGDGFDQVRVVDHGDDGAFTAWYADAQGTCVGVLTHDFDPDYDGGRRRIEEGAACP